ncbi:MAG: hypothetical protein KA988_03395 [Longilinea sp.]|nr:hypothetical protein [Longilinea sp.]
MSYEPVPPEPAPVYEPAPAAVPANDKPWTAITSLVLGVLNLCLWVLPCCNGIFAIGALVLGFLGLKTSKRGFAIAGLVLGGLTLLISIIWTIVFALNWEQWFSNFQ